MKRVNILFTSVGRRVELLRAFRDAYRRLGVNGKIVATDVDPLAPALGYADQSFLVAPTGTDGFASSILKICENEEIDRVFPLIDPDIPALSGIREELLEAGSLFCSVSSDGVRTCRDKWLTTRFFQELSIPTPKSWLAPDAGLASATLPLFIKPRGGSAGRDSFKVNTASQLAFFQDYVPEPIVQEWLPGPEITTDILCDSHGRAVGGVSRKRIEVRCGEVAKGVTVAANHILKMSAMVAEELGAKGPVTVQCIMKGEQPYFTEVNPRFGGGVPLGIAAGLDSPSLILAEVAGLDFPRPEFGEYKCGLYMSRFDDSQFLTSEDLARHPCHSL